MAAQLRSLSLLLLLLLTFQEPMVSEAAILCPETSILFKGLCVNSASCSVLCLTQGYLFGKCSGFKCVCAKRCTHGGREDPGAGPPGHEGGEEPPEEGGGGGDDEEPSVYTTKS